MRIANQALAAHGLQMGIVDDSNDAGQIQFSRAVVRGFLQPELTDEQHALSISRRFPRRNVAVLDASSPEPTVPVGTVSSWPMEIAVPGGSVPAWAISAVTVAPTHRRRGIARALLTEQLRAAAASGSPLAGLTVSESTIYRRFGFGPATFAADLRIDTRRAGWAGPQPTGRITFVPREIALEAAASIFPRAQSLIPGEAILDGYLLARVLGDPGEPRQLAKLRYLRFDDANGTAQGLAVYQAKSNEDDLAVSTLTVNYLCAVTDEAYIALWKSILEMDLITTVTARLRSVDEPLRYLVADPRAIATTAVNDHHWLRILDPAAVLQARTYSTPGSIVVRIEDELGLADGTWRLDVGADLHAVTTETDLPADVTLDVSDMGSLLVGGVRATVLRSAARLSETTPGTCEWIDAAFAAPRTPWLSTWY